MQCILKLRIMNLNVTKDNIIIHSALWLLYLNSLESYFNKGNQYGRCNVEANVLDSKGSR